MTIDTHGSVRAGVGHVLRSMALARQLRERGAEITLLSRVRPELSLARLAARGLRVRAAGDAAPQIVVVDRPDVSAERLARLHRRWPQAKLVALDYYGPPVDGLAAIVNLNEARRARAPVHCRGLRYAILRPQFARLRKGAVRARPRRVFLGFGGTDPRGWSKPAAAELAKALPRGVALHMIDGSVREVAGRLRTSDVAVIGGGTMLIEAACLGVPAVVVPRTPEELSFARRFARAGAARIIAPRGAFPAKRVRQEVLSLLADAGVRRNMGAAGRALVDGRGVERVAKVVLA